MLYLRYAALTLAFMLIGWQAYSFFNLDEEGIRAAAGNGTPTKFIQVAEDELQELNERLAEMEPFSDAVLKKPSSREFGREEKIFFPD
ncbi:MAG: hypothetical protein AB7J40_03855 [Candidatus Altimarinota bacterium]